MTKTQLPKEKKDPTTQGYIADFIINIQKDCCPSELYPRIRLVIKTAKDSHIIVMNPQTLKHLIRTYSSRLSRWYGQEVSICSTPDEQGKKRLTVFPLMS